MNRLIGESKNNLSFSPNPSSPIHPFTIFSFLILIFELLTSTVFAFNIPEKLEYDLTWAGVKAGTSTLEITNTGKEFKIISTAKSAPLVSVFYTVDDRVESTLIKNTSDKFIGQPVNYRLKIREGRHRRDKEVIFKNEEQKVIYINHLNNEREEFDIPQFTLDPLSSFYYLRTIELNVGKPVYVTIFDSKKVWDVEVQVLGKEKVSLPQGSVVDTIVIKPLMKSEGIFYRKGDIFIWLTDDEKRIPVRLKTKVAFGSITATLVGGSF
ncbi:MAG: DUF3108 domain-containing protein [Nitrospirae bacterium]|nr:DUF3108 domain-containing protein [Nitrospirota bacterium]